MRTFDDGLVVKGLDGGVSSPQKPSADLTFRENVVWCDWGRAMELGAETRAPSFERIRFEDSDIIRSTHIAMDIQHGDRAAIRDVVFENIRAEFDDEIPTPVYQHSDEQEYDPQFGSGYCPSLAVVVIYRTPYSQDPENGTVEGVLFKDIEVLGNRVPPSSLTGLDAARGVKGVVFENVRIGGKKVETREEMGLTTNGFVEGVEIR